MNSSFWIARAQKYPTPTQSTGRVISTGFAELRHQPTLRRLRRANMYSSGSFHSKGVGGSRALHIEHCHLEHCRNLPSQLTSGPRSEVGTPSAPGHGDFRRAPNCRSKERHGGQRAGNVWWTWILQQKDPAILKKKMQITQKGTGLKLLINTRSQKGRKQCLRHSEGTLF